RTGRLTSRGVGDMPEEDGDAKNFYTDVPQANDGFFLKGSGSLDWGMSNRLARVFRPQTGRTVMLAIDHGYFQGPTTGLERVDVSILPLVPLADALMCTRGILRSVVPPSTRTPVVMRASGGPSILKELSDEQIAIDIEDAARLNVAALAVQVFIGGEHETQSIHNLTRLVDMGLRYGIPVMGVTAVGKQLTRDAKYLRLACRIIAELGAQFVKTYYCDEGFDTVTASCPVPVVMAGGKKLPELDALTMASRAVTEGAAGVDMGRNIFQSDNTEGMMRAVTAVVHERKSPQEALEIYRSHRAAPVGHSSRRWGRASSAEWRSIREHPRTRWSRCSTMSSSSWSWLSIPAGPASASRRARRRSCTRSKSLSSAPGAA